MSKHQNEQMSDRDNANSGDFRAEQTWRKFEVRASYGMPAWRLQVRADQQALTPPGRGSKMRSMWQRIIVTLIKTGKPEVAQDNSALDICRVYWLLDMCMKEDITEQREHGDRSLGQGDNQKVHSPRNQARKVPSSSYQ